MASKNELDDLLSQVPTADLAAKFGVDEATIDAAVRQALPGLVGGLAVNASDEQGAAKLASTLEKHAPQEGTISLDAIDEADGEKIVKHVLGDKKDDVALALGSNSGNSVISGLIPQLLPLLAPIVLQFLSGKVGGQTSTVATNGGGGLGGVLGNLLGGVLGGGSGNAQQSSGGGLGDLLGGVLGGGSDSKQSSGGGIGDLLGGLLGGGSDSKQSSGGGLGDLLGGLLGGKK
ncbi:DUF937 domain-containing protein [Leucobacter musarum]|uniref:DUF937 domain-containing protein n=1 Tax=Leucobacter musarum TaxID=1930747 RepID=UPI000949AF7D|nr:DUF937 domain-containing protein [Leucobacter musarum]